MARQPLKQIVAYVDPDLYVDIDMARKRSTHRLSISSYVEGVLRRHVQRERKRKTAVSSAA